MKRREAERLRPRVRGESSKPPTGCEDDRRPPDRPPASGAAAAPVDTRPRPHAGRRPRRRESAKLGFGLCLTVVNRFVQLALLWPWRCSVQQFPKGQNVNMGRLVSFRNGWAAHRFVVYTSNKYQFSIFTPLIHIELE
jgi:hypothetical protein